LLKIIQSVPIQSRWIIALVVGVHAAILFSPPYGQSISSNTLSADTLSIAIVSNVSKFNHLNSDQKSDFTQTAKISTHQDIYPIKEIGNTGNDLPPSRSLPNLSARSIHSNPKPPYPLASRRLGEQGTVRLSLCINRGGAIESVSLVSSSGYEKLDRSAIETVTTWKFSSLGLEDQIPPHCYSLPIQFRLEV
jgi:TonB family protein